jgi:hypothetical protein
MAEWKSRAHLEDHYDRHRGELRTRSIEEYDASAQETIRIGVAFTYDDPGTGLPRTGYFHRDSSRMTAVDIDGFIVSHFQADEFYVVTVPRSTYRDD